MDYTKNSPYQHPLLNATDQDLAAGNVAIELLSEMDIEATSQHCQDGAIRHGYFFRGVFLGAAPTSALKYLLLNWKDIVPDWRKVVFPSWYPIPGYSEGFIDLGDEDPEDHLSLAETTMKEKTSS